MDGGRAGKIAIAEREIINTHNLEAVEIRPSGGGPDKNGRNAHCKKAMAPNSDKATGFCFYTFILLLFNFPKHSAHFLGRA